MSWWSTYAHMAQVPGPGLANAVQLPGGNWRVITKERPNGNYSRGYLNTDWGPTDFGPVGVPTQDFEWIYTPDLKLWEYGFLDPLSPSLVDLTYVTSVAVGGVSTNAVNVTGANVATSTSATTVGSVSNLTLPIVSATVGLTEVSASATFASSTTAVIAGNPINASVGGSDLSASAITVGSIPSLTFPTISAANLTGLSASATIASGPTGVVGANTVNAAVGTSGTDLNVTNNPEVAAFIGWSDQLIEAMVSISLGEAISKIGLGTMTYYLDGVLYTGPHHWIDNMIWEAWRNGGWTNSQSPPSMFISSDGKSLNITNLSGAIPGSTDSYNAVGLNIDASNVGLTSGIANVGLGMNPLVTIPYTVAIIEQLNLQLSSSAIASANATSSSTIAVGASLGSTGSTALTIPDYSAAVGLDFLAVRNSIHIANPRGGSTDPYPPAPTETAFDPNSEQMNAVVPTPIYLNVYWEERMDIPEAIRPASADENWRAFHMKTDAPIYIKATDPYGNIDLVGEVNIKQEINSFWKEVTPGNASYLIPPSGVLLKEIPGRTTFILPKNMTKTSNINISISSPAPSNVFGSYSVNTINPSEYNRSTVILRKPDSYVIGGGNNDVLSYSKTKTSAFNFFWGGSGKDKLTGQAKSIEDVFAFRYGDSQHSNYDEILNFEPNVDKILIFAPDNKHLNGEVAVGMQVTPSDIRVHTDTDISLADLITNTIVTSLNQRQALLSNNKDGYFIIIPSPIKKDDNGNSIDPYGVSYTAPPEHLDPLVIKVTPSIEYNNPFLTENASDYFL